MDSPVRYDPWVPRIISLVAVFVAATLAGAASPVTVEIVLDASETMNHPGVGEIPIHSTVRESLSAVVAEAVASETEPVIGLRLAGGNPDVEEDEWCSATVLSLPPAEIDSEQWRRVLDTVEPRGHRPLIASVLAALDDLGAAPGVRRIVVVTSGDDQCGETPQQVAAALAAVDQPIEIRMVGLGLDGNVLERYGSVPIRNVTTAEELLDALRWAVFEIEDGSRPTEDPVPEPTVSLAAPSRIEVGERIEIGRHVTGHLRTTMHSPETTGREHGDTSGRSDRHRGGHGRRAEVPRLGHGDGYVTFGRFAGRAENASVLRLLQSDPHGSVQHSGDGRNGPSVTNRGDAPVERLCVRRRRESQFGVDRRLHRHDGPAGGEGIADLVGATHVDHDAQRRRRLRRFRRMRRRDSRR